MTLAGFLDDDAYLRLLARSDAVVVLTDREDTLLSGAWEAIALGRPLVVSGTQALRTTFGDAVGYVDGERTTIAAGIDAVLGDPLAASRVEGLRSRFARDNDAALAILADRLEGRGRRVLIVLGQPVAARGLEPRALVPRTEREREGEVRPAPQPGDRGGIGPRPVGHRGRRRDRGRQPVGKGGVVDIEARQPEVRGERPDLGLVGQRDGRPAGLRGRGDRVVAHRDDEVGVADPLRQGRPVELARRHTRTIEPRASAASATASSWSRGQ